MKRSGFTLIELLVVLAILVLVSTLVVPAVSGALRRGARAREMNAGRNLGQGLMLYANEHRGRMLPGYADQPAEDSRGEPVPRPANMRYPWRLAPYLGYAAEDVFLLESDQARRSNEDWESFVYRTSIHPALGMNVFFVGGDMSGTSGQGLRPIPEHEAIYGVFSVTRYERASSPSSLIAFASARHGNDEDEHGTGFHKIHSPRFTEDRWAGEWDPDLPADAFGFVDFRWEGKAVVSMLDGSVRLMGLQELKDMRHWSDQAARANDPDWTISRR